MLTILLVTTSGEKTAEIAARHPAVEILQAHGVEDALEKLVRNRRVDAVLLATESENSEIERVIREEHSSPPPFFAAQPDRTLEETLDRLVADLEG